MTTKHQQTTASHQKTSANHRQATKNHQQTTANHQQMTTNNHQVTANCQEMTTNDHTCTLNQKTDVLYFLSSPSYYKDHFDFKKHMQSVRGTTSYLHTSCAEEEKYHLLALVGSVDSISAVNKINQPFFWLHLSKKKAVFFVF